MKVQSYAWHTIFLYSLKTVFCDVQSIFSISEKGEEEEEEGADSEAGPSSVGERKATGKKES